MKKEVYEINRVKYVPSKLRGSFKPPCTRRELQALLYGGKNGEIRVPSKGSKVVYLFKGIETLDELIDALTYVLQEDFKSGVPTYNAMKGYCVYTHSQYERVRKKLYGV